MDWSKIKVRQYYEIMDIIQEEDPLVMNAELIKCIWNVDVDTLPYVRLHQYCKELDFLATPYKPKAPKEEYIIAGVKYKPILDLSKITTAQYIDFKECCKRNAHKELLNVLFIKDGSEYGKDIDDHLWQHLTLDIYSDVMFFFQELLKQWTINTLNSSEKKMRRQVKKTNHRFPLLRKMAETRMTISQLNEADYGQWT